MKKTNNKSKSFRPLHFGLVLLVSGIFLFGATVFTYAQTFRGKILPGVSAGSLELGGLTRPVARERLAAKVVAYESQPVVITIGSGELSTSLAELGVSVDVDATIARAYARGRTNRILGLFAIPAFADTHESVVVARIDQTKLDAYLTNLQTRFSTPAIEPILTIVDDQPVVEPGRTGKVVTMQNIGDALQLGIGRMAPITLNAATTSVEPSLTADALAARQPSLRSMISGNATLVFGKIRYTVTAKQLASWIAYDPNTANNKTVPSAIRGFTINNERAKNFFQKIADNVYIAPKKTYSYTSQQYGEYAFKNSEGRKLDLEKTKQALLLSLTQTSRTANVVTAVAPAILDPQSVKAPKPKGKVIAVDVGKQVAFAFENNKLIFWTRASTGKAPRLTPTGEWKIITKTPVQTMKGPGYNLPGVKWVMPYHGDYTLHTAYWHTNFGQPMSHGCTNLSEKDAKWFYDWAEIGTPVVIFNSNVK